jgi:hypothetical protein
LRLRPTSARRGDGGMIAFLIAGLLAFAGSVGPDLTPPPGALNPQVTQATIYQTICVRGWTRTIRPPASYTRELKHEQMAARHLPGPPSDYQEDHFIPLELGGAPWDPRNLWPQPIREAERKDVWEARLNHAVCDGAMSLADAQHRIADPALWRIPAPVGVP